VSYLLTYLLTLMTMPTFLDDKDKDLISAARDGQRSDFHQHLWLITCFLYGADKTTANMSNVHCVPKKRLAIVCKHKSRLIGLDKIKFVEEDKILIERLHAMKEYTVYQLIKS